MEFYQTWWEYDVAINWLDFEWDYIAGGGGGGGGDQIWNVLSYYEFYKNA